MNAQCAVVLDETQLPKTIHEEADSRTGSAYHLRQQFLANFGESLFPVRRLFRIGPEATAPQPAVFHWN